MDGADFWNAAELVESRVIQLVDVGEVLVRQGDVWEGLHVPDSVGYSGGKLGADVVCGVDQPLGSQTAAKEGELAEADGTGVSLDPAVAAVRRQRGTVAGESLVQGHGRPPRGEGGGRGGV